MDGQAKLNNPRMISIFAMKKILLLMLLGLYWMAGYAQSGELYFSLTPIVEPNYKNQTDGIYMEKSTSTDPLFKGETISFHLKSTVKDMDIAFIHQSFNKSELARRNLKSDWRDEMEIITTGTNIASYHTVYNLDSFFRAKSAKEMMDWLNTLDIHNKKIYFFDQRDYSKGKITLIQVKFLSGGFKDNFIYG